MLLLLTTWYLLVFQASFLQGADAEIKQSFSHGNPSNAFIAMNGGADNGMKQSYSHMISNPSDGYFSMNRDTPMERGPFFDIGAHTGIKQSFSHGNPSNAYIAMNGGAPMNGGVDHETKQPYSNMMSNPSDGYFAMNRDTPMERGPLFDIGADTGIKQSFSHGNPSNAYIAINGGAPMNGGADHEIKQSYNNVISNPSDGYFAMNRDTPMERGPYAIGPYEEESYSKNRNMNMIHTYHSNAQGTAGKSLGDIISGGFYNERGDYGSARRDNSIKAQSDGRVKNQFPIKTVSDSIGKNTEIGINAGMGSNTGIRSNAPTGSGSAAKIGSFTKSATGLFASPITDRNIGMHSNLANTPNAFVEYRGNLRVHDNSAPRVIAKSGITNNKMIARNTRIGGNVATAPDTSTSNNGNAKIYNNAMPRITSNARIVSNEEFGINTRIGGDAATDAFRGNRENARIIPVATPRIIDNTGINSYEGIYRNTEISGNAETAPDAFKSRNAIIYENIVPRFNANTESRKNAGIGANAEIGPRNIAGIFRNAGLGANATPRVPASSVISSNLRPFAGNGANVASRFGVNDGISNMAGLRVNVKPGIESNTLINGKSIRDSRVWMSTNGAQGIDATTGIGRRDELVVNAAPDIGSKAEKGSISNIGSSHYIGANTAPGISINAGINDKSASGSGVNVVPRMGANAGIGFNSAAGSGVNVVPRMGANAGNGFNSAAGSGVNVVPRMGANAGIGFNSAAGSGVNVVPRMGANAGIGFNSAAGSGVNVVPRMGANAGIGFNSAAGSGVNVVPRMGSNAGIGFNSAVGSGANTEIGGRAEVWANGLPGFGLPRIDGNSRTSGSSGKSVNAALELNNGSPARNFNTFSGSINSNAQGYGRNSPAYAGDLQENFNDLQIHHTRSDAEIATGAQRQRFGADEGISGKYVVRFNPSMRTHFDVSDGNKYDASRRIPTSDINNNYLIYRKPFDVEDKYENLHMRATENAEISYRKGNLLDDLRSNDDGKLSSGDGYILVR